MLNGHSHTTGHTTGLHHWWFTPLVHGIEAKLFGKEYIEVSGKTAEQTRMSTLIIPREYLIERREELKAFAQQYRAKSFGRDAGLGYTVADVLNTLGELRPPDGQ